MNKLLFILIGAIVYAGNSKSASTKESGTTASTSDSLATFPYTATYSSKFSIGRASNVLAVLNIRLERWVI